MKVYVTGELHVWSYISMSGYNVMFPFQDSLTISQLSSSKSQQPVLMAKTTVASTVKLSCLCYKRCWRRYTGCSNTYQILYAKLCRSVSRLVCRVAVIFTSPHPANRNPTHHPYSSSFLTPISDVISKHRTNILLNLRHWDHKHKHLIKLRTRLYVVNWWRIEQWRGFVGHMTSNPAVLS